jgi:hypothetical protein
MQIFHLPPAHEKVPVHNQCFSAHPTREHDHQGGNQMSKHSKSKRNPVDSASAAAPKTEKVVKHDKHAKPKQGC